LQAASRGDAVAVVCEGEQLSYRQLTEWAVALASRLRSLGVGPEVRVALCCERSVELVVAVVAVLAAGGVYVPLDPDWPRQRLREALADTGAAAVVVAPASLASTMSDWGVAVVTVAPAPAAGVEGGYLGVLERILASVQRRVPDVLRLSTVATEIRWSAGRVVVEARKHGGHPLPSLQARAAIVTLPLGVLRAPTGADGAIRFAPRLHDVERAAGALVQGPLFKLLLRFRTPFWSSGTPTLNGARLRGFGFAQLPGAMIPTWWTTAPVESGVLTGWAGGPLALELSALGPEARRNRALECLAQLFGTPRGLLEDLLEDEVIHDWQADPFARGGYAVTPVGALGAARVLARPVADTLFFAGEHTHTGGQAGTVHGALETGEAAARACLAVLREGRSRR